MALHEPGPLLAHHCDGRLALEVDVWVAADVDCDPLDGAYGEPVRRDAGVVVGHGFAAVPPHAESLFADHELARLGLDADLADLHIAVVEGEDPGRDTGGVLA